MTPPPRGHFSSAWWTTPPSSTTRVSSKPKASWRNLIRALAFLARNAGQTVGAVVVVSMPSFCAEVRPRVLYGWELFGHPHGRRAAGDFPPLPGHVGLVVVTAGDGHVGESRPVGALQQAARALEAKHAGRHLGGKAELAAEELAEVAPAV